VPAGVALATAAAIRLITEPLRPTLGTGPVWWYAAAIAAGTAIVVAQTMRRSPTVSSQTQDSDY
jgi:hypothetical protein